MYHVGTIDRLLGETVRYGTVYSTTKTKKPYSLAEQLELNQSDIYPGLLPWEPLITGNRDYMTSQYIADEGTKCEECGKTFTAGDPIVHGCGVDCCSWECAIEYGKNHLYVHHIGIY